MISGAYGTVYRARDKTNEQIVALKKMRFSLTEDGVPMAILREISLLKQLEKFDHPNIVRYMSFLARQIDRFSIEVKKNFSSKTPLSSSHHAI